MTIVDTLYFVIPALNSLANVLLKLSVDQLGAKNKLGFIRLQLSGYSLFGLVMVFSYMFLMTHPASYFVIIFSSNYLSSLYASRWFLRDPFTTRDIMFDILIVVGIVTFYCGAMIN